MKCINLFIALGLFGCGDEKPYTGPVFYQHVKYGNCVEVYDGFYRLNYCRASSRFNTGNIISVNLKCHFGTLSIRSDTTWNVKVIDNRFCSDKGIFL